MMHQLVAAAAIGTVCLNGYIMDRYCIDLGRMLDGAGATLERPDRHTVHCLVDVAACRNSGYEVLADPVNGSRYCRAYQLDDVGNGLVVDRARSLGAPGSCSTCTGSGTLIRGFRTPPGPAQATIIGEVIDAEVSPPLLAVTDVRDGGCDGYNVTQIESTCGNVGTLDTISGSDYENRVNAHGALMLVSWGLLIPAGAVLARFFKHREPLWFHLHRSVQVVGLLLALVGFIIALSSFTALSSGITSRTAHAATGIVVMSLGLLQPLNALLRPNKPHDGKPPTASRRAWHALHAGSGWLAIGLSIPTIILGITFVPGVAANRGRFQFGYGAALVAVFGLLVFSFCDRETYRRNRGGPAVSASEEQHMTEMKGKVEEST